MNKNIEIQKDKIAYFCRRHHICRLAIFGSALRDDFEQGSDVDVLVDFEPGRSVRLKNPDFESTKPHEGWSLHIYGGQSQYLKMMHFPTFLKILTLMPRKMLIARQFIL